MRGIDKETIMRLAICTLAFIALGSGVAMAQERADWRTLYADESYDLAVNDATVGREGEQVQLTYRIILREGEETTAMEADALLDCHGQTLTLTAARAYDAAGVVVRSVEAPEDRRKAEPIYQGEGGHETLYRDLCSGSAPLLLPPRPGPPPVPVPPRRD
jgi:hypothetical protein